MTHFGIDINYNTARERLEGGNPRKPQLRVKDVEWYMANMGYISPAKFRRMAKIFKTKKILMYVKHKIVLRIYRNIEIVKKHLIIHRNKINLNKNNVNNIKNKQHTRQLLNIH